MYRKVQCNKSLEVRIWYVIITYIFIISLLLFHIYPILYEKVNNLQNAFIYSGIVGFFVYGIYNFTNLALLKDYSLKISIMDTLWGTILFTILGKIILSIK